MFSLLILHIKSSYKFSEQDTAVSTLKKVDGENNDVSTGNIEANTDLTDTVEDSGTENTISYEAFKEMLEDQFEKLSKNLSDGFTKFDWVFIMNKVDACHCSYSVSVPAILMIDCLLNLIDILNIPGQCGRMPMSREGGNKCKWGQQKKKFKRRREKEII